MYRVYRFSILLMSCWQLAWVRPHVPTWAKPVNDPQARLEYLRLRVSGTEVIVPNGQEVTIVRGDSIEIVNATLRDKSVRPRQVNLVGYQDPGRRPQGEDRGFPIDTGALSKNWSEKRQDQLYGIAVQSGPRLHGVVYLRIIEPLLKFAVLNVEGQKRVFRAGERVEVSASDRFHVERIETNAGDSSGIKVQVVRVKETPDYELIFLRSQRAFAKILLHVRDP